MVTLAVVRPENAKSSLAETGRLFEHRVEHRREIAGRGIDDLQYLCGRSLLFERLVTLGFALDKLTLQIGNGCSGLANVLSGVALICGPRRDRPSAKIIP